jgi:chromosome segregation ATPase
MESPKTEDYLQHLEDTITAALQAKIQADRLQITSLQENLHRVTEERARVSKEVEHLSDKITSAEANLGKNSSTVAAKVKKLQKDCEEFDRATDALEVEVHNAEQELNKQRGKKSEVGRKIEEVKALLDEKRNKMKEVRTALGQKQDEGQILKNLVEAKRAEQESSVLNQSRAQLRELKKEIDSSSAAVAKLNEEVKEVQLALVRMDQQTEELSQELGLHADYASHSQTRANSEIEKVKEKIWRLRKENENLRSQNYIAQQTDLQTELKIQREEGEKLKRQLA